MSSYHDLIGKTPSEIEATGNHVNPWTGNVQSNSGSVRTDSRGNSIRMDGSTSTADPKPAK